MHAAALRFPLDAAICPALRCVRSFVAKSRCASDGIISARQSALLIAEITRVAASQPLHSFTAVQCRNHIAEQSIVRRGYCEFQQRRVLLLAAAKQTVGERPIRNDRIGPVQRITRSSFRYTGRRLNTTHVNDVLMQVDRSKNNF